MLRGRTKRVRITKNESSLNIISYSQYGFYNQGEATVIIDGIIVLPPKSGHPTIAGHGVMINDTVVVEFTGNGTKDLILSTFQITEQKTC